MNRAAVLARARSPNKARDGTQAASRVRDVFIETCQIDVLCRRRTRRPSHDGAVSVDGREEKAEGDW